MARASSPLLFLLPVAVLLMSATSSLEPEAAPWPPQFHSVLFANLSGEISLINLWYDLPNGRNFNIIRKQLGELLYDLEWNNGTSFYYTLPPDRPLRCSTVRLPVGILRPDWMEGASYVGQQMVGPFLCNVWTKVDFITYYEDVHTKRPVHWVFTTTGRSIHVLTFDVGAVLDDDKWQAPAHCFGGGNQESRSPQKADESLSLWNLNPREGFKIAS